MNANIPTGYKLTEVGVIPVDWEVSRLGDVCGCIVPGRNKPKTFGGDIPWITTPDLEDGKFISTSRLGLCISRAEAKSVGSKVVPHGSVLMSCAGELGIVALTQGEIVVNQQLHVFLPTEKVDGVFLLHSLAHQKEKIAGLGTKTAVPYLNKNSCNSIKTAIPPLPEQRAIAAALSDVDKLLTKLEELIAKKRDLKQATMQQLLTGKTRLKGFSGDWEVKKLGEIAEIIGGSTPSSFNANYWNGTINWFTPTEIGNYKYTFESVRKITKEGFNNCASKILPIGAILLTTRAAIGDLSILMCEGCTNQGFQSLVVKDGYCNEYIYYLMQTLKNELIKNANGSTFLEVSPNKIKKIKTQLPELKEQTAIAEILSDMDAEIAGLEARRDKTRLLKQGMMQELLTGRIRLV